MEHEFWHGCWGSNKIAFHKSAAHKLLVEYYATATTVNNPRVLVPLCGKSLDMLWLMNQGAFVVGAELSEIAVQQFFSDNQLNYHTEQIGELTAYIGERCVIYCGDFFALTAKMIGKIDLVYDRAALVALPASMREQYVSKVSELSNPTTRVLLIVIDYPATEYTKPPFAINEDMVNSLYQTNYTITKLKTILDPTEIGSRLNNEGISAVDETVFVLNKIA